MLDEEKKRIFDKVFSPENSVKALFENAHKIKKSISIKDAKEYLETKASYTRFLPGKTRFRRRKTIVNGLGFEWQGDIAFFDNLKNFANKRNCCLCLIDVFSGFLYAEPLTSKRGKTVAGGLERILIRAGPNKPKFLQTDKGSLELIPIS